MDLLNNKSPKEKRFKLHVRKRSETHVLESKVEIGLPNSSCGNLVYSFRRTPVASWIHGPANHVLAEKTS